MGISISFKCNVGSRILCVTPYNEYHMHKRLGYCSPIYSTWKTSARNEHQQKTPAIMLSLDRTSSKAETSRGLKSKARRRRFRPERPEKDQIRVEQMQAIWAADTIRKERKAGYADGGIAESTNI